MLVPSCTQDLCSQWWQEVKSTGEPSVSTRPIRVRRVPSQTGQRSAVDDETWVSEAGSASSASAGAEGSAARAGAAEEREKAGTAALRDIFAPVVGRPGRSSARAICSPEW